MLYSISAMEKETPKKKFSLCRALIKINPDASKYHYKELVKSLLENDLSVCECMHYLMEEKRKKAFQKFKNEKCCSEKYFEIISRLSKELLDDTLDPAAHLFIHFPPRSAVSSRIRKELREYFSNHYPTIRYDSETPIVVAQAYRSQGAFSGPQDVKARDLHLKDYHIRVSPIFPLLTSFARKATLLHEKQHLEDNVTVLLTIMHSLSNFPISTNNISLKLIHEKCKSYEGIRRIYEARADRIPAACNTSEVACNFKWEFEEFSEKGLINLRDVSKSIHPSNFKRYLWARRIFNLKVAEEELQKDNKRST